MAPSAAGRAQPVKAELHALVLLDSFDQQLDPLQFDVPAVSGTAGEARTRPAHAPSLLPQCLLPVAGVPLLEYTLEWLAFNGVTEILLFSGGRSLPSVREYLTASRWGRHVDTRVTTSTGLAAQDESNAPVLPSPRLRLLTSADAASAGDAIRSVDGVGALRGEGSFVLIERPVVANFDLRAVCAAHAARAALDSNATLTAVLRPVGSPGARSPLDGVTVMAVDTLDGRLWGWRERAPGSIDAGGAWKEAISKAAMPKDVRARLACHADWAPTGVYVCTPSVAVHFSDNYDYGRIGAQYIANEVDNVDMGWRFHVHVAEGGLIASAASPRELVGLTALVLEGWAAPYTSDGAWAAHPLAAEASTVVRGTSVLGAAACVATGAQLTRACVGARAVVEAGAVLIDTIILSGAIVRSGAVLESCVIGPDAEVGAGVRARGAVVGRGVWLAPGHACPPLARLTCSPFDDGFGSVRPKRLTRAAPGGSSAAGVGAAGVGRVWPASGELEEEGGGEEEEEEGGAGGAGVDFPAFAAAEAGVATALAAFDAQGDEAALIRVAAAMAPILSAYTLRGAAGAPSLARAATLLPLAPPMKGAGAATTHSGPVAPDTPFTRLAAGVFEIVQAGRARSLPPPPTALPHLAMEVRSFKFATNARGADVLRAVLPIVLDWLPRPPAPLPSTLAALLASLPLLAPFAAAGTVSDEEAVSVVRALEAYVSEAAPAGCPDREPLTPLFGLLLNALYDADVASDVGISEWAAGAEEEDAAPALKSLHASKFVQMLLKRIEEEGEEESEDSQEES
jgi:NDP-sugar pyrophosphorylase family protein